MSNNQSIDYVIFEKADRSAIKEYDKSNSADNVYRIPKCCPQNQYIFESLKGCGEAQQEVKLELDIFESNQTGLDPDAKLSSSDFRLIPYYGPLKCSFFPYDSNETKGLIYNSSFIIEGYGIFSHQNYCIDGYNSSGITRSVPFVCTPEYADLNGSSHPNVYVPVLIVSAICFALSAIAYAVVLKAKDIHKRCFVMFCSSMCLAFLSLIIMQKQNNDLACNIFGFLFIFMVVLGFLSLLITCVELLYLVRHPIERTRYHPRWHWYGGISIGLACLVFVIALFTGDLWVPDLASHFIMDNYGSNFCIFECTIERTFVIFVPIISAIVGSFGSLVALTVQISRNENNVAIKNHFDWVSHRNSYKFLSRTYFLIIAVATFWLFNLAATYILGNTATQLALDIIKASLGIVTFIGFVGNKYTRREIKQKFTKKEKEPVSEDVLGLNGLPTPETPVEVDPLVRQTNRFSTFQNNRVNNR